MPHPLLKSLASVQMGYSFRSGVDYQRAGSVRVIQMKDLTGDCITDVGLLGRTDMKVSEAQQARRGDIVFRSRGDSTACTIIDVDPGLAVVAAPLLRIRVTAQQVMPAYLNWYLNQPSAQAYLAKNAEGSNVKMIRKEVLELLEIAVPSIAHQQRIVALAQLAAHEKQLAEKIASRRVGLLSEVMVNYAEGGASR